MPVRINSPVQRNGVLTTEQLKKYVLKFLKIMNIIDNSLTHQIIDPVLNLTLYVSQKTLCIIIYMQW